MRVYTPYLPLVLIMAANIFFVSHWHHSSGQKNVLSYATSEVTAGNLLTATNQQRATAGVASLGLNSALNQAAQTKATDMVTKNYWSHNTPEGTPPWTFMTNAGYSYSKAGENLAYGYTTSAETISAWYASPGHRENMLDSGFTEVGFGVANSADFNSNGAQTVVVAMYGRPYNTPAPTKAATPAPTAAATKTTPKTSVATPATPAATPVASPVNRTVTVTVLDADNKAVEGAKVTLHSAVQEATTDKDGLAVFSNVENGDHKAIVEVAGNTTETPLTMSDTTPAVAVTIKKPVAASETPVTSSTPIPVTSSKAISRIELIAGRSLPWLSGLLVVVSLVGGGYILGKHARAFHRMITKGERYLAHHMLLDVTIVSLMILCFVISRTTGIVL